MRKIFLITFILFLALFIAGPKAEAGETSEKWGLIIGIGDYPEEALVKPMPYVLKDVEGIKRMFIDDWKIPEGNISTLYNEEATLNNIKDTIADMALKVGTNDYLFVYYSGYGEYQFPDFNGDEEGGSDECIVPYDCEANFPRTYITDDKFTKWLAEIKGKFILLLDFDGGSGMVDFTGDVELKDRTLVISPYSLASEQAYGEPSFEHAVLTHYLLESNKELFEDYQDEEEELTLQIILEQTAAELKDYLEKKSSGHMIKNGNLDPKTIIIMEK